jgi:hypothetical protein
MSADRISYDSTDKSFVIDNQGGCEGEMIVDRGVLHVGALRSGTGFRPFTADVVGQIIAASLMGGVNKVQFNTVTLSVNYLTQMLGFVGKHGWFIDVLSSTSDHAFDPNNPTPGFFVGEARSLVSKASELEAYALLARAAYHFDDADQAQSQAAEHRTTARRLLTQQ